MRLEIEVVGNYGPDLGLLRVLPTATWEGQYMSAKAVVGDYYSVRQCWSQTTPKGFRFRRSIGVGLRGSICVKIEVTKLSRKIEINNPIDFESDRESVISDLQK